MLNLSIDWDKKVAILSEVATRKPYLAFTIKIGSLTFTGENLMFIIRDDQTANINIKAVDAKGFDAALQTISYTSSDENVLTVNGAVITPVGLGSAQVQVVADADLGAGVTNLVGTLDVTVVAGQAVALAISAEVVPTPAPAPTPAPVTAAPSDVVAAPINSTGPTV